MTCPCGLGKTYEACCAPFHNSSAHAPTAEALMRSRYSAFVKREITYLRDTTWPASQKNFDDAGYLARAEESLWLGLDIIEKEAGLETDTRGTVTFIARSIVNGQQDTQREKSLFKKKAGQWYYVKALAE